MMPTRDQGGIGGCLREVRRLVGWTQAELARAIGISATALSRIETGKVRPRAAMIRLALGVLGFSTDTARLLELLMKSGFL